MGGEFGQGQEWSHDAALDWARAASNEGQGLSRLVGDLNAVLRSEPALHRDERDERGFDWSVADDSRNSVYAFIRRDPAGSGRTLLVVSNFTPVRRDGYRVGVPQPGCWTERLNTDSGYYGGGNAGTSAQCIPSRGRCMVTRSRCGSHCRRCPRCTCRLMHDRSGAAPGRMAGGR